MSKLVLILLSLISVAVFSQGSVDSFYGLCMRHGGTISHCREYAQSEFCKVNGGIWNRGKCIQSKNHINGKTADHDVVSSPQSQSPPKGNPPPQKQSPSFSQCESAYNKTQITCNGQTIAPAVTALLNSVAQMKSSGNMKAACESAKKVSV